MKTHYLNEWQKKALTIYYDKYGESATVDAIKSFEQTGKLGKAMLKFAPKDI